MNFSVFTKPICRFLIHRYMGQFLKTELTTDQLEFKLADGTACVQQVNLNVEYINGLLENVGIVSLIEGYVDEISAHVPWKELMTGSTEIYIRGLELTVTPMKDVNMANTQDLVSSMIGSIASSMDLARSIIDDQLSEEADNGGVEQFASMIDQVISRIKVIFENTTIRLECDAEYARAMEIQIERMEFIDEQLEACKQQSGAVITAQPNSLYTVTDLNKLLHIQGVKLFTDVWQRDKPTSSMYASHEGGLVQDSLIASSNFQSCYSHISAAPSVSATSTASRKLSSHNSQNSALPSSPILFAQTFGERITIRVEIDVLVGGCFFFLLTPSQLFLIRDLLSRLVPKPVDVASAAMVAGGKPMGAEHLEKCMEQLHHDYALPTHKARFTAWSGEEKFHDMSNVNRGAAPYRQSRSMEPLPLDSMEDILGESSSVPPRGHTQQTSECDTMSFTERGTTHGSSSTLVERRPDVFIFTFRAPSLVGVITHDDPLSAANIRKMKTAEGFAARLAVEELEKQSLRFFEKAANLKLSSNRLDEQRQAFSQLYTGDHIRLTARTTVFKLLSEHDGTHGILEVQTNFLRCDLIECLTPSSVLGSTGGGCTVDLLNFSSNESSMSQPDLSIRLSNSWDHENEYTLELNMEACKSEVDLTIVDRLSNLLCTKPFFVQPAQAVLGNSEFDPAAGLRDNFLSDITADQPQTYKVKLRCPTWSVNLRIPVTDLSADAPDYWIRHLHQESLHLLLGGAYLEVPRFLPSDMAKHGSVILQCDYITGSFLGDIEKLQCTTDELTFLHAFTSNNREIAEERRVELRISYDLRDKALQMGGLQAGLVEKSMMKSVYGSFFKSPDGERTEGPFSKARNYYGGTKIVSPGTRQELKDFSERSRTLSNVNIELNMPRVNLCLPSQKFFEVLYNRFANDLALWEPRAPVFKQAGGTSHALNPLVPLQNQTFFPIKSDHTDFGNDSLDETPDYSGTDDNSSESTASHNFSLQLKADEAKLIVKSSVNKECELTDAFECNVASELRNAEMFLVYGYHGDCDLAYFYLTAGKTHILHRNIKDGTKPFARNVRQGDFCSKLRDDVCAEPVPADQPCVPVADDNFTLALKIHTRPVERDRHAEKNLLLAFALRNTLVHFRPFMHPSQFWVQQTVDFFNVLDYEVPGYEWPAVHIDLHLNLTSVVLGYDHSCIVPDSNNQIRLSIGSCNISAYIVQDMEKHKFDCILENTSLHLGKKKAPSVAFDNVRQATSNFVKVFLVGFLHLEVAYVAGSADGTSPPSIELFCTNDHVKVWLCSDTVIELMNTLTELMESDVARALTAQQEDAPGQLADLVTKANMSQSLISGYSAHRSSELTIKEEERLMQLMQSAMVEDAAKSSMRKISSKESSDDEFMDTPVVAPSKPRTSNTSATSTDDEFVVVDQILGSGVKNPTGEPRVRILEEEIDVVNNYLVAPDMDDSELVQLPKDYPHPILKYVVKDLSLILFLYGGNDFGTCADPPKTYSEWSTSRNSIKCMRDDDAVGGLYRDHTVCVEARVTKISLVCEVFSAAAPTLSLNMLTVNDIEIRDHLLVSEINKVFYQYTTGDMPRHLYAPLLSVKSVEDQRREGKLKISLLPIRLNFDQDTLEFLQDFSAYVSQNMRLPNGADASFKHDAPVIEVPQAGSCFEVEVTDVEPTGEEENEMRPPPILPDLPPPPPNLEDLFSEEDVKFSDSVYSATTRSEAPAEHESEEDETSTLDQSTTTRRASTPGPSARPYASGRETFYREFAFSPACTIRLDYVGKRVKADQGALVGLLIGLSSLHRTEIVLKEVHNLKGMLGFAVEDWVMDIRSRQLGNVLGSYGPISSITQIAQGVRDLFFMPLNEFQKEDGRIIKGIQRGASSFGVSTAAATIDATQMLAATIQGIAELVFDIVTPDYAYQRHRRYLDTQRGRVPNDIREGLHMAYDTVREGVRDTAHSLQAAAQEDRAGGGRWGFRGLLRQATPTAIRPIVIASQATLHVLGGLKSQLKPDDHKEELEKWRHPNAHQLRPVP